jgi:hypothetical protein
VADLKLRFLSSTIGIYGCAHMDLPRITLPKIRLLLSDHEEGNTEKAETNNHLKLAVIELFVKGDFHPYLWHCPLWPDADLL